MSEKSVFFVAAKVNFLLIGLLGEPNNITTFYNFAGGYCSGEDFEINRPMEVCVLNTDTLRWKVLPPSGIFHEDSTCSDVPFHRYGHSAVVWKEVVYIWGGRNDSSGACNTLYRYDTVTGLWSRPSVHGLLPQKRDGHAAAIIGDYIYVFGKLVRWKKGRADGAHSRVCMLVNDLNR